MIKINRKKVVVFILVGIMAFVLCGCIDNPPVRKDAGDIKPPVTILSNESNLEDADFFYVIDDRTGVVYLGFEATSRAGITVMLNTDGSPITYDQINEEVEDDCRKVFCSECGCQTPFEHVSNGD